MGDNFGPSGTTSSLVAVTYSLPGRNALVAESCEVITFTEIQCLMTSGTGRGHLWHAVVAGQDSNTFASMTSYGAPVGKFASELQQHCITQQC